MIIVPVISQGYMPHSIWQLITWSLDKMCLNTLRPRQNGRHFADDISKYIFRKQIYEFRLIFHWSLFLRVKLTIIIWTNESLLSHSYVTQSQWVNGNHIKYIHFATTAASDTSLTGKLPLILSYRLVWVILQFLDYIRHYTYVFLQKQNS